MKYLNKSFIVSMSIDNQEKWDTVFKKEKNVKINVNDNVEQVNNNDKQINRYSKK